MTEPSLVDEQHQHHQQYRDEYADEYPEEAKDKIAIIEGQRVRILDSGGYTQMRKSEFFSKRLKKDTSASRLTANSNN